MSGEHRTFISADKITNEAGSDDIQANDALPPEYCIFKFKTIRGVTRDPFNRLDISTPAQNLCDISKNLRLRRKFAFLHFPDKIGPMPCLGGLPKGRVTRDPYRISISTGGCVTRDCRFERKNTVPQVSGCIRPCSMLLVSFQMKSDCPIILLRNLAPSAGLCNALAWWSGGCPIVYSRLKFSEENTMER
jgi:hypothetical protein